MSENNFTRNRKLSFHSAIVFIINFLTKSLSVEIDNFIRFIGYNLKGSEISCFTKSAFVQYRKKIKPEVFKSLSDSLIEEFYTDNDESVKLWNGFRLLAVDGSRLVLPDTNELESIYGKTKNQSGTGVVQARISVLYDVLNRFAIDGVLSPLSTGENVLALNHLAFAKANDLIIYDRGYPSFNLIYEHFEKGVDFLIRVKADFSNVTREFHQSRLQSDVVRMQPGKNIKLSDKPYSKNTFVYFAPKVYRYFNPKVYHFNIKSKLVFYFLEVPPKSRKRALLFSLLFSFFTHHLSGLFQSVRFPIHIYQISLVG